MSVMNLAMAAIVALQAGPEAAVNDPGAEFLRVQFCFNLAGLILSVAGALYVCVLALLFLTSFLAPGITQRGAEQVQSSPYRSLLVGVAADVVLILLAVAASRVHALVAVLAPILILLVMGGLTVVAQDLGRRVFALSGRSGTRLGRIVTGWAVGLLASAVPYLGWVVIGPILLTMGIGGFTLSLFSRASELKPAAVAPASPPPAGAA